MKILKTIAEVKEFIGEIKARQETIGLVPTMGYLHEGHMSLMNKAKGECTRVIATIFVNPLQFGEGEDFKCYPRDLERDFSLLRQEGVDAVFTPSSKELYPEGFQSFIEVTHVSQNLCGKSRPGHFRGVTTVVAKLFNIVEADRAYFGLKDAQQVQVIKAMVRDLNMNIKVVQVPIVRESDGLAISSRNSYLKLEEREAATVLFKSLKRAKELVEKGQVRAADLKAEISQIINNESLAKVDYIEIVDFETMKEVSEVNKNTLIALAVKIGKTRLIDNILLGG